ALQVDAQGDLPGTVGPRPVGGRATDHRVDRAKVIAVEQVVDVDPQPRVAQQALAERLPAQVQVGVPHRVAADLLGVGVVAVALAHVAPGKVEHAPAPGRPGDAGLRQPLWAVRHAVAGDGEGGEVALDLGPVPAEVAIDRHPVAQYARLPHAAGFHAV